MVLFTTEFSSSEYWAASHSKSHSLISSGQIESTVTLSVSQEEPLEGFGEAILSLCCDSPQSGPETT